MSVIFGDGIFDHEFLYTLTRPGTFAKNATIAHSVGLATHCALHEFVVHSFYFFNKFIELSCIQMIYQQIVNKRKNSNGISTNGTRGPMHGASQKILKIQYFV